MSTRIYPRLRGKSSSEFNTEAAFSRAGNILLTNTYVNFLPAAYECLRQLPVGTCTNTIHKPRSTQYSSERPALHLLALPRSNLTMLDRGGLGFSMCAVCRTYISMLRSYYSIPIVWHTTPYIHAVMLAKYHSLNSHWCDCT